MSVRVKGLDTDGAIELSGDATTAQAGVARALSVRWNEGGEIVSCAPLASAAPAGGADVLDASGALVLPGLVCAHVESGLEFRPGFPARAKESEAEAVRRLLDAHDEASLAAAARRVALRAAKSGVTVLFDLWRGRMIDGALDVIADAFAEVGIRAAIAVAVDERHDGVAGARRAIAENARFADAAREPARFRAMMGIADPARVLASVGELTTAARKREMSMHVLYGGDAAARRAIAERGALRPGSVVVLDAPIDMEERALLRDLAAWTVTRPREEAARGAPPVPLDSVVARVALGGWHGSGEVLLDAAALGARHGTAGSIDVPRIAALLAHGWDLAAEIFDVPFGRYGAESPADFSVFEPPIAAPVTASTIPAHLARLSPAHLHTVVCAGEVVVERGRATKVDEAEVRAKALEQAKRVWARAT